MIENYFLTLLAVITGFMVFGMFVLTIHQAVELYRETRHDSAAAERAKRELNEVLARMSRVPN